MHDGCFTTCQAPTNVKAYYRKARACQALHQHKEAIEACEAGLKAAQVAGGDVEAASKDLRAVRDKVRPTTIWNHHQSAP